MTLFGPESQDINFPTRRIAILVATVVIDVNV
jgi:hypothetical protein